MKKFLALLLALAMMMSLVACGDKGKDDTTEAVEAGTEDLSDYLVKEPITITVWHTYSNAKRAEWLDNAAKTFNETNGKGITVEISFQGAYEDVAKVVAACVADNGKGLPAMVTINSPRVINWQASGIIEPLDKYFEALSDKVDMSDYLAAALDAYTMDGQLWGLPFGTSAGSCIYNKTVCDENNLPFPKTWEEFKTWCKDVYEKTGKTAFAFVNSFNYMNNFFINVTGIDPLGDGTKSTLNDEKFKTFVKELKELCDKKYCVMYATLDDQLAAFKTQEVVAFTSSTNDIVKATTAAEENGFEVDTQLGVTGTDKAPISTISGAALVTFALLDQQTKAAAAEFMAFLTNSENNLDWVVGTQMLPSHYTTIASPELQEMYVKYPGYKNVYDEADNIISKNKTPVMQSAMEVVVGWLYGYVSGDDIGDFDTSWQNMVQEVDDMLYDAAGN